MSQEEFRFIQDKENANSYIENKLDCLKFGIGREEEKDKSLNFHKSL
jgi:hypothetical protein